MNKRDRNTMHKYVRRLADEMGLRDWRFDLVFAEESLPPGGLQTAADDNFDAEGSCSVTTGRRHSLISFRSDFRKHNSPEEQREIVVHELVHCHLHDMREFIRTGTLPHLAQATYDALSYGHDLIWEHATDSIASAWATKFPLIDWKKK